MNVPALLNLPFPPFELMSRSSRISKVPRLLNSAPTHAQRVDPTDPEEVGSIDQRFALQYALLVLKLRNITSFEVSAPLPLIVLRTRQGSTPRGFQSR